jgi:large subunit ribosomal protein L32
MANPKRKISRSKRDMRRSHWFAGMKPTQIRTCENCGEKKLPHSACPSCGYYKGENYITPKGA